MGQNRGRGGAILTPNELVLTFRGSYVCANFFENRSRNATVRVLADGQTHRQTDWQTDANRFYNLSHAICYSYGTDKNADISSTKAVCEWIQHCHMDNGNIQLEGLGRTVSSRVGPAFLWYFEPWKHVWWFLEGWWREYGLSDFSRFACESLKYNLFTKLSLKLYKTYQK